MILLLVRAASALDAHGTPVAPTPGTGAAPAVLVPEAGAPPTGVALTFQGARELAMAWPNDGTAAIPLLDDLAGLELGGGLRLGRFGVTASLPLWVHYVGRDGAVTGAIPGDLRVGVPVTLWERDAFSFGLRLDAVAPTGANAALLGGGWGGGMHAAVGRRGVGWTWTVGAGVAGDTAATFGNVDRSVTVPILAQVGYGGERFGGGLEGWFSPSLTAAETPLASAPGELLARVGLRLDSGLSVALAGGYAAAPGIGSAGGRVLARVGWSAPPKKASAAAVVARTTPTPDDVVVRVRDNAGKPVDATITVVPGPDTTAAAPAPLRTGRDGDALVPLAPGAWTLTVSAPGRETQARDVVLEADAWRPVTLDAVLPADERGEGALSVQVIDVTGAPVDAAEVRLDGGARGATSTGGSLALAGLDGGDRTLEVTAPGYAPAAPLSVPVGPGNVDRTVVLAALPGGVRVLARTGDTPAAGAQVRFEGPGEPPSPVTLGADGEAVVQLPPGTWTARVSSPGLGVQEREVAITSGTLALLVVDVRLAAATGDASLGVRVLDPAGNAVDGAVVTLDGAAIGRTSNGGTVRVAGLAAGEHALAASGPLLRPAPPRTLTLGGARDVDVVLGWAPGTLSVRARGPDGEPVDAAVRFSGRVAQPSGPLGPDGEGVYTLPAGDWQVAVSAPSFGVQERAVRVEPDAVARIEIDAGLLREAGAAGLALVVLGPQGAAVSGARVQIDGRDAGTVGGTGALTLSGLAPGKHRVEVFGEDDALGSWAREIVLAAGANPLEAKLGWAPRAVRVRARTSVGPVNDAIARPVGPAARAPLPLGADGEGVFALDSQPGWSVAASSATLGITSARLPAPSKLNPVDLDLLFTAPVAGAARLAVEVRDPDGARVRGARMTVGDAETPTPDGYLLLPDAPLGPLALRVEAPGFTPMTEELVLVEGDQERRLRLVWLARTLAITVTDGTGAPIDAEVRLAGPADVRPGATGADGKVEARVLPGAWQVLVSAPAYGARSVAAPVPAGDGPIEVKVVLDAARVEVTAAAVRLDEAIHFGFDAATIEADSFRVLEEVVAALQLHPEVSRVEIQGHTDDRGEAVYNLDLSQRRAEAVRAFLVERGVAVGRLTATGYGSTVPLATNGTEAGRATNRRVQLVILGRDGGSP